MPENQTDNTDKKERKSLGVIFRNVDKASPKSYDLKGTVVRNLVNDYQEENYHNIIWNGLNDSGQAVASGRYILKMSTPGFSDTITMTLLK